MSPNVSECYKSILDLGNLLTLAKEADLFTTKSRPLLKP